MVQIWNQASSHIAILLPLSLPPLIKKEKCCVNINVILVMELKFMGYQIFEKMSFSCPLGMGANQNEKNYNPAPFKLGALIQREQCYVHINVILVMEFYSHRFQE